MLQGIGRLLFSAAIIGIGVETLVCASGHKVVPVIPWLPPVSILVYPVGVLFVAGGAGLLFQASRVVSAITVGMVMILSGLAYDVPRQFDAMSAAWRTNVLEPIVIGCLAWLGFGSDRIPEWLRCFSRYLIAFGLIIFGVGHFQVLSMIAAMVPPWMPFPWFWTIFFGLAFLAAGLSFATGLLQRWAEFGAGLMFAIWTLTIHLPALLAKPVPDNWSDVFIVLALWGGFWALVEKPNGRASETTISP